MRLTKLTGHLMAAALASFAACSPEPDPLAEQGWDQELTWIRSELTSTRALEILEDGSVSDAEWAEVQDAYSQCMGAFGFTITFDPGGGYSVRGLDTEGQIDAAEAQCQPETGLDHIEFLYFEMRSNPGNVEPTQLVLKCLKEAGLVPESFTADDLDRANEESMRLEDGVTVFDPAVGFGFEDTEANLRAFQACGSGR